MTEHPQTCPSPAFLLEALTEHQTTCLDHVSSCPRCGQNPELQILLSTWRQLDTLPEIQVAANFNARLQARIKHSESKQRRWKLFDGLFDWLHIPALAVLISLLAWLPAPDRTAHQPLARPSSGQGQMMKSLRQRPFAAETLQHLQRLYRQSLPQNHIDQQSEPERRIQG